jgi:hypothetical protein
MLRGLIRKKNFFLCICIIILVYLKPGITLPDGNSVLRATDCYKVFVPTRVICTGEDGKEYQILFEDIRFIISEDVKKVK